MNPKLKGFNWHDLYEAGALVNPKCFLNKYTVKEIIETYSKAKVEFPDWDETILHDWVTIQLKP